jgi:phage FluMu protein Com
MPKPRTRPYSMQELRSDIIELSRRTKKETLLASAITKTLQAWKPEKYKDLIEIAVLLSPIKAGIIRTHKIENRWWLEIRKPIITPKKLFASQQPTESIKCRHCGTRCELTSKVQVGNHIMLEYKCPKCETINKVFYQVELSPEEMYNELFDEQGQNDEQWDNDENWE